MSITTIVTRGLGGNSADGISTGLLTRGFGGIQTGVVLGTIYRIDARTVDMVFSVAPNREQAENPSKYTISPTLKVVAVKRITDHWYRMTTDRQENGQSYVIMVTGISP